MQGNDKITCKPPDLARWNRHINLTKPLSMGFVGCFNVGVILF